MEELKEGIKNKNKADKIERAVVAGGVGAVAGGVAGGVAGAGGVARPERRSHLVEKGAAEGEAGRRVVLATEEGDGAQADVGVVAGGVVAVADVGGGGDGLEVGAALSTPALAGRFAVLLVAVVGAVGLEVDDEAVAGFAHGQLLVLGQFPQGLQGLRELLRLSRPPQGLTGGQRGLLSRRAG